MPLPRVELVLVDLVYYLVELLFLVNNGLFLDHRDVLLFDIFSIVLRIHRYF